MAAYYPRRVARFADLQKAYPGFETYDDFEEDRIESVAITKSRGKGAPKKKRTAAGKSRKRKRQREGQKMLICCVLQNPRSLARRRGRRRPLRLATYPTRTKSGACKSTHRNMDLTSREEEHLEFQEDRGVYGVLMGAHPHIWRQKQLALYKIQLSTITQKMSIV
jgi:hypothetical protein